jgi:indole-3-glycerol phosphate synthase
MPTFLDRILAQKRLEIAALDPAYLRRAAEASRAPRDFLAAVSRRTGGASPALIAELKRASPSRGMLAPHLDLLQLAQLYQQYGAAAISVLTDTQFFLGKLDTMRELRFTHSMPLPLLRKDFILSEAQVYETRAAGADAVLLITAVFEDDGLFAALYALARSLGLAVLVEVHNESEIERALALPDLCLVGINNRNLSDFSVSLATTERLRPLIPPEICVVAESGIFTAVDVSRMAAVPVDAILVGEALVTSPDIGARVRELSGAPVAQER